MDSNPQISQETIEQIEFYLLDAMDAEQRISFEKRLETDAGLRFHTNEMRLVSMAISEQSLREKLDTFHDKTIERSDTKPALKQPAVVRSISWQKWASAAAVVLVIVAAWVLLNQPSKDQKLFADYYKADPGLVTTMGGNEEYEFNHAMIDYKMAKYDSAIVAWKRLQLQNPKSDTLNYFIGSSYLALGNWQAAAKYFEAVVNDSNSEFVSDAYWYGALAYMRLGRKQEMLQYLGQSTHANKDELVAELNK